MIAPIHRKGPGKSSEGARPGPDAPSALQHRRHDGLHHLPDDAGEGCVLLDDIDGGRDGNNARWINHACDPNCETDEVEGRIFIKALRDIENTLSPEVIQMALANQLPQVAAAFQQKMGEVHVTAVDGANPFGYIAAAVEGVMGLARSAGLKVPTPTQQPQ